jgi:catalase
MHSPTAAAAFRSVAVQEAGAKLRQRSDSFSDHFSQATLFWNSMSDWEKDHIAAAFAFELNMVVDQGVRNRVMNELLCNITPELADMVSTQTGIDVAPAGTPDAPTPSAPTPSGPLNPKAAELRSPALSMDKAPPLVRGRKIAILVADGVDSAMVKTIVGDLTKAGQVSELIGPTAGAVIDAATKSLHVNRAAPNAPSVIYDAVLIPPGVAEGLAAMPIAHRFIDEAFRHGKPIAAAEDARALLVKLGLEGGEGVVIGDGKLAALLLDSLAQHRFPRRVSNLAPN